MKTPLTNLELALRLDLEMYSDTAARKAMVEAFPAHIRPNASVHIFLFDQFIPYIVLTAIVGVPWALKKVLGPSFDELGNYLRDSLSACLKHGKRMPPAIGLYIEWTDMEVRISIETQSLLGWSDARPYFQKLGEYLANGLGDVPSKGRSLDKSSVGPRSPALDLPSGDAASRRRFRLLYLRRRAKQMDRKE